MILLETVLLHQNQLLGYQTIYKIAHQKCTNNEYILEKKFCFYYFNFYLEIELSETQAL